MIQFSMKLLKILFLSCLFLNINYGFSQLKHQNKLFSGVEKYNLIIKFQQNSIKDIINNKPVFTDSLLQIHPNKTNTSLIIIFSKLYLLKLQMLRVKNST